MHSIGLWCLVRWAGKYLLKWYVISVILITMSFFKGVCNFVTSVYFGRVFSLYLQHRLKSSQKEKVRQFIAFTQTDEKSAISCLSQHDWKLHVATDQFFQYPHRYVKESKTTVDKKKIQHLFERYKGM